MACDIGLSNDAQVVWKNKNSFEAFVVVTFILHLLWRKVCLFCLKWRHAPEKLNKIS